MSPPYIYHFPSQHQSASGVTYTVPGAKEIKLVDSFVVQTQIDKTNFIILHDVENFDFSWHPNPLDPPYVYVFGNQWYGPEQMPTVEYHVPGAQERKYLYEPRATLPQYHSNRWHTIIDCEWNYSWVPDPGDPPFIYVFGNQWHGPTIMPTVEYHVPGATERKYMDWPQAELLPDQTNWSVPEEIDSTNIDFSWVPDPGNPPYIYHFGSEYQISTGLTYTVPGATDPRFEGEPPRLDRNRSVIEVLDILDRKSTRLNSSHT